MLDDPKAPSLLSGNIEASQQFRDDIDQFMAQMFGALTAPDPVACNVPTARFPSHDTTGTISPAIDIHETRSAFVLTAELPGLTAQDIEITLADGHLILRGQKPRGHEQIGDLRFCERSYGRFSRAVALPRSVMPGRISAHLDSGILRVTLPKDEPRGANQQTTDTVA